MKANLVLTFSVLFNLVYGESNDDVDSFYQNIDKRFIWPTDVLAVPGQTLDICNNSRTYPNIADCYSWFNSVTFSTKQFKASCVEKSCPELKNPTLCPLNKDESLNTDAMKRAVAAVASCFQKGDPICGHPLQSIPLPGGSANLLQTFGLLPLSGKICTRNGDVKLVNLHKTQFQILDSKTVPAEVVLKITSDEMYLKGFVNSELAFITLGLPLLNIPLKTYWNVNLKLQLSFNNRMVDFKVVDPIVNIKFQLLPIELPINLKNIPVFNLISNALGSTIHNSTVPHDVSNFFAKYLSTALQAIINNCPKPKPSVQKS